jgi:transcriptional regulator with XRE-family HTH domain
MDPETPVCDLRGLFLNMGLSIGEVHRRTGLSTNTLYSLLYGRRDARMGTLENIANALGVPWLRVVEAFRLTRQAAAAASSP